MSLVCRRNLIVSSNDHECSIARVEISRNQIVSILLGAFSEKVRQLSNCNCIHCRLCIYFFLSERGDTQKVIYNRRRELMLMTYDQTFNYLIIGFNLRGRKTRIELSNNLLNMASERGDCGFYWTFLDNVHIFPLLFLFYTNHLFSNHTRRRNWSYLFLVAAAPLSCIFFEWTRLETEVFVGRKGDLAASSGWRKWD